MKLMNEIEADVAGTVVKFVAEDAANVAPGDVLCVIEPNQMPRKPGTLWNAPALLSEALCIHQGFGLCAVRCLKTYVLLPRAVQRHRMVGEKSPCHAMCKDV
eukprot:TRINITY_DN2227_c0_g1_i2.p2 TRINITY_DN2227_c0_g1~~TRINITY_DN2227_c0_g1_i2.p2  ORF type:complete len:102 (-),score=4.11 TRINITY_DN2227_c0_g1_i2:37-342(-)